VYAGSRLRRALRPLLSLWHVVATLQAPERTVLWLVGLHPSVHFNLFKNCYNRKQIQKHDVEDNGQQGNYIITLHACSQKHVYNNEQFAQSLNQWRRQNVKTARSFPGQYGRKAGH